MLWLKPLAWVFLYVVLLAQHKGKNMLNEKTAKNRTKKKTPQTWRNLTSLEKEKNNNDKTPKQTNKQRKERQKPLTPKTTFL